MTKHPIVLLEINEVPWRLIERYRSSAEFPNINIFFAQAHCYTSIAVDSGELSPWVTWPTLHRGMNNEAHGVLNLGQDPSTFRGTPIWEEFRKVGESVGICGSMQSWPPIDPGKSGFFLPDTFAHDSRCYPRSLEAFQAFNLAQVKKNPRVLSRSSFGFAEGVAVARSAFSSGVRFSTLFRIVTQLISERLDSRKIARRPVFQAVLFWDIFRKQFNPASPPAFSSFFTNHVAGVMHRYWRDVFPEDFQAAEVSPGYDKTTSHESTMRFALSVLDDMVGDVLRWRALYPNLVFVFASSMGQGPVHRDEHEGKEIIVTDIHKFMSVLGLSSEDYAPLLAMVPQIAVEIADVEKRQRAIARLHDCKTTLGAPFIRVQEIGATLSITVAITKRSAIEAGKFHMGMNEVTWSEAGITAVDIEAGTGYHVPEGTLAFLTGEVTNDSIDNRNQKIPADAIKAWLLRIAESGPAEIQNPPTTALHT